MAVSRLREILPTNFSIEFGEGVQIEVNNRLLQAHSAYIAENPAKTKLQLPFLTEEQGRQIVDYLYTGNLPEFPTPRISSKMLRAAIWLRMDTLKNDTIAVINDYPINWVHREFLADVFEIFVIAVIYERRLRRRVTDLLLAIKHQEDMVLKEDPNYCIVKVFSSVRNAFETMVEP